MRRGSWIGFALVVGCSHAPPSTQQSQLQPVAPAKVAVTLDATASIDESTLDRAVSPCDDFYQFACGGWLAKAQIPADRAEWSRGFDSVEERNLAVEHQLLEEASQGKGRGQYASKLGDYWTACMDEATIEQAAPSELKGQLAHVDSVKDARSLMQEVAREQRLGIETMFSVGPQQDYHDATLMVLGLGQGGIGLPERDYYLKSDGKFPELRSAYVAHVQKMLELSGETAAQAKKDAAAVMRLETRLATASQDNVAMRDPHKTYHRLELVGLTQAAPRIDWKRYLGDMGLGGVTAINVDTPAFVTALGNELRTTPLDDWRAYLRWHLVSGLSWSLSKPFVDETFAFYAHTLSGVDQIEPRWKRCVHSTDARLGFALGQAFVETHFGAEGKTQARALVAEIEQAMAHNLDGLGWLDEATRKQAHEKLAKIANQIGYPNKWRNYDDYTVTKSSYLQNVLAGNAFEQKRQLAKIGKPVDRDDWGMTPPTVNAYYDASLNQMVFPAGILQPPFFDAKSPKAVNYGAIGMVMGHELTHGFDDEGRKFDAVGNLRDWWSPKVSEEFDQRAQCVAKQYDGYVAVDEVHLNGRLTLGENLADAGGVKLAYAAYVAARGRKEPVKMGAWTDDQLFFIGTAQAWCTTTRPDEARLLAATDAHSPAHWRINGPMSNLPEFAAAFACKTSDRMVKANACSVW